MLHEISMVYWWTNQSVSGKAYWPLTPILRAADVPLTMPLTLPRQEASRAIKSGIRVISYIHEDMRVFEPEQRVWQRILA